MEVEYYLTDPELYIIYCLANIRKLAPQPYGYCDIDTLMYPNDIICLTILNLAGLVHKVGLKIELVFDKEYYKKNHKENIKECCEFEKIFNNKFDLDYLAEVASLVQNSKNNCLYYIKFNSDMSKEEVVKMQSYLKRYIKDYADEKLIAHTKNIKRFSSQKEEFDKEIKKCLKNYGSQFIVYESDVISYGSMFFLHNILALEYKGLVRVEYYILDSVIADNKHKYGAKITVLPKYIEELKYLSNEGKEGEIRNGLGKILYSSNTNILIFKNCEFDFTRKYNQKDLLATLFKNPQKNWYYEEILEDWNDDCDVSELQRDKKWWRQFYTAGDEINKIIAIKVGTKDFLIKNTKQIRINPKYV